MNRVAITYTKELDDLVAHMLMLSNSAIEDCHRYDNIQKGYLPNEKDNIAYVIAEIGQVKKKYEATAIQLTDYISILNNYLTLLEEKENGIDREEEIADE